MTKPIVVLINGSNGAGKDTFIKLFSEFAGPVGNVSTVDEARRMAEPFWDGEKTDEYRMFLHRLNHALWEFGEFPLHEVWHLMKSLNCKITFVHCRESIRLHRCLDFFENKGYKVVSLLIENDRVSAAPNPADTDVGLFGYDVRIENNGTMEELGMKAGRFYEKLMNGDI